MIPKTVSINIDGSLLTFYGAVLSTITATAQIISFVRDRANLKLTYQRDMELVGHPHPGYQGMTITTLRAANAGRLPPD